MSTIKLSDDITVSVSDGNVNINNEGKEITINAAEFFGLFPAACAKVMELFHSHVYDYPQKAYVLDQMCYEISTDAVQNISIVFRYKNKPHVAFTYAEWEMLVLASE